MWWYSFYGGYDSIPIYNFKTGVDGDVLYVPNGADFAWSDNALIAYGHNGGSIVAYTDSWTNRVFNYSTDGWSTTSMALAGFFGDVQYYSYVNHFAGNGNSELKVSDDWLTGDYNKKIYLDSSLGWQTYSGITNIIADSSTGNNEFWGDWQNNKIVDGSGNSALWGGWGGDDTLTGGSGADTFLYNDNGGNDIITDANWNDTIYLFQSDINNVGFYYDSWNNVMHLYTGNSDLQVNCATGDYWYPMTYPVYQFADGTRLTYINGYWQSASYDTAEDTGADISTNPLWGNANTFYGTADADNIFINKTGGNDLIFNAAQDDTIHLCDTALSDVVATSVSENSIAVAFNTGEVAMVSTTENLSPTFKLASGESYVYNREAGSWQEA